MASLKQAYQQDTDTEEIEMISDYTLFTLYNPKFIEKKAESIREGIETLYERNKPHMASDNITGILYYESVNIEHLAIQIIEEKEKLELENNMNKQKIAEYEPKASYLDTILNNKSLVTVGQIAKDYGMSAQALNKLLHDLKVQYKQSGQWLLYSNIQDKGYTHSSITEIEHKDGSTSVRMNTKWTQKGRLFIYELLKEHDILPVIEKEA